MLRKLIKYDLRNMFRYLWIFAVASLLSSVVGGLSVRVLSEQKFESDHTAYIFAILGVMLAVFVMSALMIAAMVFTYYRFYQNFYTDEGYLTFTLPVRKMTHLNSKLISSLAVSAAAVLTMVIDIFIMLAIGLRGELFVTLGEFFHDLFYVFLGDASVLTVIAVSVELVLLFLGSMILGALTVFLCISLASMVTKKYRVILGIVIAYIISGFFSFIASFVMGVGSVGIIDIVNMIPDRAFGLFAVLFLLCAAALEYLCVAALYTVEYRILDRHLNLA